MMMKDENGDIWVTGLKLDYTPRKLKLENDKGISKSIRALACGRKHYVMVNEDNQLLIWGNVFKEKSDITIDGYNVYYGDTLFENGKCINLSMKYGLFGVVAKSV